MDIENSPIAGFYRVFAFANLQRVTLI